jgi:CysZ protein
MRDLGRGLGDLGRAFEVLKSHSSLWKWMLAPTVVTLVLLVAMILGVASLVDPLVSRLASQLPAVFEQIGSWILTLIVVIGLGFAALLVFVALVGMVAGPFNELLSEAVEEKLYHRPAPKFSLRAFARGAIVGIVHGLRRLAIALLAAGLLFALGFLPVIGAIAAVLLGGWIAARASAYDCYDAVLARRELAYKTKLAYLERHRARTLGLGAGVAGLLLVPGLNLIALGLGAIGATLASHDLERAR